jgi:uncharacterized protein involved in exopolysaccharide biosynthesis
MSAGPRHAREDLERGIGLVRRCSSFWLRTLLVFVITALAAGPYSVTRPRTYRSESVILYQESIRSEELTGSAGGEGPIDGSRRLGARLREALLSRANLEPVLVDMRLYPRLVERHGLVDAVEEMRKHVTFRAREGDTFEVAFEGTSPDEAQEVTRRLGDCIVHEAATRRLERASTLKEFVDAESERNKVDLKVREAALASFLALHPELKRPLGADLPVVATPQPGAPVEELSLPALEQRALRLEWQLRSVARPAPPTAEAPKRAEPPPPESPELVAARRELADKLARFTERHPDVLAARSRVHAAGAAHAAASAPSATDPVLPSEAPVAEREALRQQLAAVQSQLAARRAALSDASVVLPAAVETPASVSLEVEYRRLLREVNDKRERQRQLDERQFKATITASSAMNDRNVQVSVLDPAYRPTHASSRPRSTLLAGALLACFALSLLVLVVSLKLDDRIHDGADLEVLEIAPLVGVVPRASPLARRARAAAAGAPM